MCGGVEYIYMGEKKRVYFPNPQAHLPVRLKNAEIDYLPWGRRKQQLGQLPMGGWARHDSIKQGVWDKWFPKPVKIIVPWAAGGGTDILARSLLTVMPAYFPRPMVVINKTGGAGSVPFLAAGDAGMAAHADVQIDYQCQLCHLLLSPSAHCAGGNKRSALHPAAPCVAVGCAFGANHPKVYSIPALRRKMPAK